MRNRYTAPFIVVIGARWLLPGDRFDRWQWAGLVLSFAGMVVAFGVPTPGGNPHELIGDLMLVLAGAAWAATTLLVKATRLVRVSYEKTLLYQLIVSAPMLALCAQAAGERVVGTPSVVALASLLYQTGWISSSSLGGPGAENLRWLQPVRPGDTLRAYAEIKDVKPSRSKPDRGVLTYEIGAINQRGELVMTSMLMSILKRSRES